MESDVAAAGPAGGSGGLARAPEGPWGRSGVLYMSIYLNHTLMRFKRSVELHRVPSCQIKVPTEARRNSIWPDRT